MTSSEDHASEAVHTLLNEYEQFLAGNAKGTRDAYLRTVHHLIKWLMQRPGNDGHFHPSQLTQPMVEMYLTHLELEGLSLNHCARVKSTISNFAHFLIEEKGLLQRNPTRGIVLLPARPLAPQHLLQEQALLLHSLVEQERDRRGAALFALGYWAGCRVSDISWLQMIHTHIGPKVGWLHIGYKESKGRDIDLMEEARKPLYEYLQATVDTKRTHVFISQRSERLTEEGIYYWFRTLKAQGTKAQQVLLTDLTFNDLRHDFADRAREADWSFEEVAYYLGDITKEGMPTMPTATRYTQATREQIQQKLKHIKG